MRRPSSSGSIRRRVRVTSRIPSRVAARVVTRYLPASVSSTPAAALYGSGSMYPVRASTSQRLFGKKSSIRSPGRSRGMPASRALRTFSR